MSAIGSVYSSINDYKRILVVHNIQQILCTTLLPYYTLGHAYINEWMYNSDFVKTAFAVHVFAERGLIPGCLKSVQQNL